MTRVTVSAGGSVRSGRRACVTTSQAASAVEGAWIVKGDWDGSTDLFPSDNVKKGYQYRNTANSVTLLMEDGGIIPAGAIIVAEVDDPGQTVSNWYILLSVI